MFPSSLRQLSLNFFTRPSPEVKKNKIEKREEAPLKISTSDKKILEQYRLSSHFSLLLNRDVKVVLTNNRVSMISSRLINGTIHVRIHKMFKNADDDMLKALSLYLSGSRSKKAADKIDAFIKEHSELIASKVLKPPTPGTTKRYLQRAAGEYYNVHDILRSVKDRHFAGEIDDVYIFWGKRKTDNPGRRRKYVKTRALGSYRFSDKTIRINPVLDSPKIPLYFVEWVVYHELLHHLLPVEQTGTTKRYHTKLFKEYEKKFYRYNEAAKWEETHRNLLLL
ncbi:MAG: hypothetical protein JXR91_09885 [Deltaproteobacteria bacterium]|nr:hypothetical protein [Deltaproteobacteria bacterium]